MGIGAIDGNKRKEIKVLAGRTNWKEKLVTAEDAEVLLNKLIAAAPRSGDGKIGDRYYQEKIDQLITFINAKRVGTFVTQDCKACGKVISRPLADMTFQQFTRPLCKKNPSCPQTQSDML
jgi:hypothetical protein